MAVSLQFLTLQKIRDKLLELHLQCGCSAVITKLLKLVARL